MSELQAPPVKMHRVKYDLSWTKNMGNFESLKVNLGLEADGTGDPQVTYERVTKWVEERLGERIVEVVASIEGTDGE